MPRIKSIACKVLANMKEDMIYSRPQYHENVTINIAVHVCKMFEIKTGLRLAYLMVVY